MRCAALLVLLGVLAGCGHTVATKPVPPPVVDAAKNVLLWNRIAEATAYRLYVCWTPGCDPVWVRSLLKVIPQTAVGVKPTYWRELAGSVGAYAVTAVKGNDESPFSVPLAFDRR